MPATILTAKVIGTVTTGLWAGYNLSLTQSSGNYPSLDHFDHLFAKVGLGCCGKKASSEAAAPIKKSAEPFSPPRALSSLVKSIHVAALSGVSLVAHLVSYLGANRSGRHPYLLYLSVGAPLVGLLQWYGARELSTQITSISKSSGSKPEPSDLSESVYEHISSTGTTSSPLDTESTVNTNAETVAAKFELYSNVVALLSAGLYLISVIGLAGDNF